MIIDNLLLLGICLFLPLSLYFNYKTFIKTFELKENSIFLELAIISSLILMIKYDNRNEIYSIFIYIIPIIISLQCKNIKLFIILLSILLIFNDISYINIQIHNLIQVIPIMIIYLLLTKYLFNLSTQVIDLSKIEKELEREKLLRSSISKLTHELKNPIAVCNGYLEMLDINDQQKTKKYIDIITSEITRSKTIIDEFSSFGKLKNIDVEELDITYLLEDTITLLKPLFKQNKGKIIFSSKEEIYIKGDYNKLKQVFINLLKNTIEAKKEYENLIVEIKIKKENKQIILTIKDNGIGMDKATLKKVSEVFFTTKQNGTGIGLAFSKEVIELHKGQLLINSKLNEGTEIKLIFPNEKVRRL